MLSTSCHPLSRFIERRLAAEAGLAPICGSGYGVDMQMVRRRFRAPQPTRNQSESNCSSNNTLTILSPSPEPRVPQRLLVSPPTPRSISTAFPRPRPPNHATLSQPRYRLSPLSRPSGRGSGKPFCHFFSLSRLHSHIFHNPSEILHSSQSRLS